MLTDGLDQCGLLVDYCDVFISCLDSHSDGTHSPQSIHCWASDAMLHFSKSDEETNSSTSWMAWGRVIFGWTIPLSLMSYETAVESSSALSPSETNGTWGLFHKTSLPNKPGLFQLVWLILNQINWVRLSEINLAYLVNLFYETGPLKG